MRIIDKVDEVVKKYSRHFEKIENEFNRQNEYFKSLVNLEHDTIGKVLKYHLVVEHYMTTYLKHHLNNIDLDSAKLTFAQKSNLISIKDTKAAFVKPGIFELNKIRNKFGHNLNAQLSLNDLGEMKNVLRVARSEKIYDNPIEIVEDFSTVACTFLIVNPEEIDLMFLEIFEAIKAHNG